MKLLLLVDLWTLLLLGATLAMDGVEFSASAWKGSRKFNTSKAAIIYHYRKLSNSERTEATKSVKLLGLQRICDARYGSRLVNWRDINEQHFLSVVSGYDFKPYKYR